MVIIYHTNLPKQSGFGFAIGTSTHRIVAHSFIFVSWFFVAAIFTVVVGNNMVTMGPAITTLVAQARAVVGIVCTLL